MRGSPRPGAFGAGACWGGRAEQSVPSRADTLANATNIPGEVKRRSLPGLSRALHVASMTNYQAGQVIQVTAGDVAHGGWCVARPDDGPVVFVRHALPGETVLARVTDVTSRLARAEAIDILTRSPDRVEPPCPHAVPGDCGGCDWQHATLPAQRSLKAAVIRQQLKRLAGLDREVTVEALPGDEEDARAESPAPGLGWRTRVQFAVRPDGVAGPTRAPLARSGRHRQVPDRPSRHHRSRAHGHALAGHDGLGGGRGGNRIGRASRDHHPR